MDSGSNFPGLYSADNRKNNDSDYSDDGHDKLSKKDLLIGKRKDKKDRGYATLEGESSPEEEVDAKSPSKGRRSNPFKFPIRKEKREKSRDKECKDKEVEKKKDAEKDKDKKKDKDKIKVKLKDKRKLKHPEADISEELPIFGVPLSIAVERSPCHDGIKIPLVVRNCIDFIQLHGLTMEGVYKVTGVKSRVHNVFTMYNKRQTVTSSDMDLTIAFSLLKQFLRSLPDPILTKDLLSKFEDITLTKDSDGLKKLITLLPICNRHLLGWLFTHFKHVTLHEKQNKMNVSLLSAIFCPLLQMSPRLFNAFTAYAEAIFPDVVMSPYTAPLQTVNPDLLCCVDDLNSELHKQESLLNLIHFEMNAGFINKEKEEQLWGVQRNITQLKRKLKSLQRETRRFSNEIQDQQLQQSVDDKPEIFVDKCSNNTLSSDIQIDCAEEKSHNSASQVTAKFDDNFDVEAIENSLIIDSNEENSDGSEEEELMLQYERIELIVWAKLLQDSIKIEKSNIEQLKTELKIANVDPESVNIRPLSEYNVANDCDTVLDEDDLKQYNNLQLQKKALLESILEEKEAILDLKTRIRFVHTKRELELARNFFDLENKQIS